MTITIAPINESHISGFHQCLDTVAQEKRYLAQTKALPLKRLQEFVHENITNNAPQFVALDDEQVVGWADILSGWADGIKHRGTLGMGLLPAYRGRGIGEQLLTACLTKAKANGITRVELEVRADNTPAIKLYERLGFSHESRQRYGLRIEGMYYDTLQMCLIYE